MNRPTRRFAVVLSALSALAGSSTRAEAPAIDSVGVRVRGILGKDALAILVGSKRAQIYRLVDLPPPHVGVTVPAPPDAEVVSGYRARGKARPLDDRLRDEFRQALIASDTWFPVSSSMRHSA